MRSLLAAAAAALVALSPAAPPARSEDRPAALWRIGRSDFLRFERRTVTEKDGKEALGKADIATVHGCDLRDDGRFLPMNLERQDFPELFAFRGADVSGTFDAEVRDIAPVRFVQDVRLSTDAEGRTVQKVTWVFSSAKGKSDEPWTLHDGSARTTTVWDAEGAPVSSDVTIEYVIRRREPDRSKPEGNQKSENRAWRFTRADRQSARHKTFRDEVNAAIDRGVEALRARQKDDGTFEPHGDWIDGTTALATYTLLSCGISRDEPYVEKALAWMEAQGEKPSRTYALSLLLMAMERAYVTPGDAASEAKAGADMPAARRKLCVAWARKLEDLADSPGSWGYPNGGRELHQNDTSNTQYAALGLRAAARLGIPVREQSWLGFIRHFTLCRERGAPKADVELRGERGSDAASATGSAAVPVKSAAGFKYRAAETRTWGSMTCAGIATLAIAREEVRRAGSKRIGGREDAEIDEMIHGGWAWLDRNMSYIRHPRKPGDDWAYYWLYSLERAGLLTGVRLVGGKDWYYGGAMELIARQKSDGAWNEQGDEMTTEICFALLFLKRATAPAGAVTGK
ncbi:MAG: hypothetical protein HMLKMBBP_03660 [Planctomycetes bacterium]|nr:hypothetical protein [Planctomycetota bacterium]